MATITQTLRWGSKGSQVETLQKILNQRVPTAKLPNGKKLVVDGIFGSKTYQAVKAFQRLNKRIDNKTALKVDGIVGENTRAVLNKTKITPAIKKKPLNLNHPITQATINKAHQELDKLIKEINNDIKKEEIIHMRCLRLRNEADKEIKEILTYDKYSRITYALSENLLILALTAGLGNILTTTRVALALSNYRIAFLVCSQIGSKITAGIVTSTGLAVVKSFLSGKFTLDEFISLSQNLSIAKLGPHLSKHSGNFVTVLGLVYTAGMAYLDCKFAEQELKMELSTNHHFYKNQAKRKLGTMSRVVGLQEDLSLELRMYYKYKYETIFRWKKYNFALKTREILNTIRNDEKKIKHFIKNGFKIKNLPYK